MKSIWKLLATLALLGSIAIGGWGLILNNQQPTLISQAWYTVINLLIWAGLAPAAGFALARMFKQTFLEDMQDVTANPHYPQVYQAIAAAALNSPAFYYLFFVSVLGISLGAAGWGMLQKSERSTATPIGHVECKTRLIRTLKTGYMDVELLCATDAGLRRTELQMPLDHSLAETLTLPIAKGGLGSIFIDTAKPVSLGN